MLTTPVAPSVPLVIGLARSRAGFFRMGFGLPRFSAGSAHTLHISRPARALHALRPAKLLAHLSVDFVARFRSGQFTQPNRSPAIESNHQLFEWVLPPLVICPFRARAKARATMLRNVCRVAQALACAQ